MLIEKVDIFFHAAASVKFDDYLRDAILTNIRSAQEAALLALEMKKIKIFLHVSTTYCNIDNKTVIDEVLYPQDGNWRNAIKLAESYDFNVLNILMPKYIGVFPNTYTYTKQLAEHCINDLLVGNVPTIICRPSVVVSSLVEPFQGWVGNFNGPVGLLLAGATGLLRVVYAKKDTAIDYVAIDSLVKIILVAAWEKGTFGNKDTLNIYNASKHKNVPFTIDDLITLGKRLYWDVPFERKIWFPGNSNTSCFYNYFLQVIFFHMIPAFFIDILLRIFGHKPLYGIFNKREEPLLTLIFSLFKIQRKIYIATIALAPFTLNEWEFLNVNTTNMNELIPAKEKIDFNFMIRPKCNAAIYDLYFNSSNFVRSVLFKETKEITKENRIRTKRMYYLDRTIRAFFAVWLFWFIFWKINILNWFLQITTNYWKSLN
ncbi:hypothetical protein ABEB36_003169 [Hypothenemus hampei]|uniref:Fatty acyl-CoA reductase n=1 Tax=Hypothenemus hampei TaxID=57062 RepID=A0ABD1FA41_HYPHA